MTLDYRPMPSLPKLAWLATIGPDHVTVFHGAAVECRPNWLVEGVWDGPFESGEFHRSEHFFGSGLVLEGRRVYVVPSIALVDRLVYCILNGELVVSNSLVLLAGFTGARLDPDHNYDEETSAILQGVKQYRRDFHILHGTAERFYQLYHTNLIWENGRLSFEARGDVREFHTYGDYVSSLRGVLAGMRENYASAARRTRLMPFTTISSGYDSTAVAALVREIGVKTCFVRRRSNSALPGPFSADDGQAAAHALGMTTINLDTRPSSISLDELYFLAASSDPPELAFNGMASYIDRECPAAVVFTGYHGDQVWDVDTKGKNLDDAIRRGGTSGLTLGEIRLKSGFVHAAVPFLFARSVASIHRISQSSEMEPWRMHTSYDRPVARRIAESAGVSRGSFATRKHAVVAYYGLPHHPQLRRQFFAWLRRSRSVRRSSVYLSNVWCRFRYLAVRAARYATQLRRTRLSDPMFGRDMGMPSYREPTSYLMYLWSFGVLSETVGRDFGREVRGE